MTEDQRSAIELLFRQYGRGVSSYLLVRLGDAELAEEITARVFLLVVRRFGQLRGSAAGWLWAIVRSELARHFREGRRCSPLGGEVADPRESPPEQLARALEQEQLRTALEALPADVREVISLKFFLGLGNREVAEVTGLTPSNVGVKVHRGLKRLRELLPSLAGLRPESGELES